MASNVVEEFIVGGYTYKLKAIRCGKANCGRCPHGPYWYFSFRTATGKPVEKYIGKDLPQGVNRP